MHKTAVIIGIYCHLPEGISDSELEDNYQSCYRPFLSTLNRFPEISAVLYFSGCILKKLEARHPEFFMLLEELIGKRQVELLGGAYYQPILPLIPNTDRLGQIESLTTYLRKSFGRRSRGCWLTEYSWEPWLASTMQTCGLDYTFLLQDQFFKAGITDTSGLPVLTEDQGRCVSIFPVIDCAYPDAKVLTYEQAMETVLQQRSDIQLATIMMPGEALKTIWHQSGLESPDLIMERSFAWFRKNALIYETTTPVRFLKAKKNAGRAYIPGTASKNFMVRINHADYDWNTQYGSLRQALNHHECARYLYAKMSYVHLLIGQLRGDKARKKTASEDLWSGQSADAFWQAPSGGICVPSIRQAAWRGLLDAELTTRHKAGFKPGLIYADIDFDSEKEFLFQGQEYNAYIQRHTAAIFALDLIKARRNIADVYISPGAQHQQASGLFLDYIIDRDGTRNDQPECIVPLKNFAQTSNEKIGESLAFISDLRSSSNTRLSGLRVNKQFAFNKRKLSVMYTLVNMSDNPISCDFSVRSMIGITPQEICSLQVDEQNWINTDGSEDGKSLADFLQSTGRMKVLNVLANESALSLRLECTQAAQLEFGLVQCIASQSQTIDQGLSIVCSWPVSIAGGQTDFYQLDLSIHI